MSNLNIAEIIAARQQAITQLMDNRAAILAQVEQIKQDALRRYQEVVARIAEVDGQLAQLAAAAGGTPVPALDITAGEALPAEAVCDEQSVA